MKKVLIPLLVLSVLCVAVVPIFSNTTTASADTITGQQYGMFTMPAPQVFYNTVLSPSDGSNNLGISFSPGATFTNLNYEFELSFDSVSHIQRYSFGSRCLTLSTSNNYYIRPTGYNVSTVFYILISGSNATANITDILPSGSVANHFVPSVPANFYDTVNNIFNLNNSYGINTFPYQSDGSQNTPVSVSIIPVVCSLYNYIDSISVYAYEPSSFSIIGLFYSHNPTYDENTSYQDGYQAGLSDGYSDGYDEGYVIGEENGYADGLRTGYDSGYSDGYSTGYDEGVVSDEPLSAFQSLLVGANQALQTPLFGEGEGAFSIMDFVVIAIGLGLLFWFLKMFAGG